MNRLFHILKILFGLRLLYRYQIILFYGDLYEVDGLEMTSSYLFIFLWDSVNSLMPFLATKPVRIRRKQSQPDWELQFTEWHY